MKMIHFFYASLAALMLLPATAAANSPLYENINVLGALDCEIDGDIRLYVGAERALRCDYEPRGVPGRLKRYLGYVGEIETGLSVGEGDFACWTVLRLTRENGAEPVESKIAGQYSPASAATIEEFQLKDATLVGGGERSFALEPRCVAPRSGANLADKMLRIDIRD